MDDILQEARLVKNELIENCETIFISSVNKKGNPNVSYAPTYIDESLNFYIYVSALAKHTQNIIETNKISFMILEQNSNNIFAKKRITFNGKINKIQRNSDHFNNVISEMTKKLGETIDMIKHMEDFSLIQINPMSALLVHGFAKAFILSGDGLNDVKHLNDMGHTENKNGK